MNDLSNQDKAVELLQQLGLKEYEAKSFVALSRLPKGTAKEISEISDVPRTRVYDAVRVLETKGLVEIQHSNPQQFRAVTIDEAARTLRREYENRTDTLREALEGIEQASTDETADVTHEVWALTGSTAIANRAQDLVNEAEEEVVVVLGNAKVFTEELVNQLQTAQRRGISLIVGTISEDLRGAVEDELPEAEVFVSGLGWLEGTAESGDDTEISRLLMVDQSTILVSTSSATESGSRGTEQAVFGRGFDNGLVTIVRRLMATGLGPAEDPKFEGL